MPTIKVEIPNLEEEDEYYEEESEEALSTQNRN